MQVTEHQIEFKVFPCCQTRNWRQLPASIKDNANAECGPHIKGLAINLMHHHFGPPRRVKEIVNGISGQSISIGSLMNESEEVFHVLKLFEADLVQTLKGKAHANFYETVMRCEGKMHWLHSASDSELTFLGIHQKRVAAAME